MAANKIRKEMYGGEVVINFYPDSHKYKLEGSKDWLVSSTGATGIIDKSTPLIIWAVGLTTQHVRS